MPNRPEVDDEDDAFDERGLLKDGRSTRVSLMMRDGLSDTQRAVMADKAARCGFDDSACRYQNGPVLSVDRSAAAKAYEDMVRSGEQAWRDPSPLPVATDAAPPPHRRDAAPVPRIIRDAATARRIKQEAYDEMVRESQDAWRNL